MIVHRTSDGIVVTGKALRFGLLMATLIGGVLGGIIAAVRFIDRAGDSVPRQEFVEHVRADSTTHAAQNVHDAFQDSLIAGYGRDGHALTCYVWRNPLPFCRDQAGQPVRP
jgi:hypothetical protein